MFKKAQKEKPASAVHISMPSRKKVYCKMDAIINDIEKYHTHGDYDVSIALLEALIYESEKLIEELNRLKES